MKKQIDLEKVISLIPQAKDDMQVYRYVNALEYFYPEDQTIPFRLLEIIEQHGFQYKFTTIIQQLDSWTITEEVVQKAAELCNRFTRINGEYFRAKYFFFENLFNDISPDLYLKIYPQIRPNENVLARNQDALDLIERFKNKTAQEVWTVLIELCDEYDDEEFFEVDDEVLDSLIILIEQRKAEFIPLITKSVSKFNLDDNFLFNYYLLQLVMRIKPENCFKILLNRLLKQQKREQHYSDLQLCDSLCLAIEAIVKAEDIPALIACYKANIDDESLLMSLIDIIAKTGSVESEEALIELLKEEQNPSLSSFIITRLSDYLSLKSLPVIKEKIDQKCYDSSMSRADEDILVIYNYHDLDQNEWREIKSKVATH